MQADEHGDLLLLQCKYLYAGVQVCRLLPVINACGEALQQRVM